MVISLLMVSNFWSLLYCVCYCYDAFITADIGRRVKWCNFTPFQEQVTQLNRKMKTICFLVMTFFNCFCLLLLLVEIFVSKKGYFSVRTENLIDLCDWQVLILRTAHFKILVLSFSPSLASSNNVSFLATIFTATANSLRLSVTVLKSGTTLPFITFCAPSSTDVLIHMYHPYVWCG